MQTYQDSKTNDENTASADVIPFPKKVSGADIVISTPALAASPPVSEPVTISPDSADKGGKGGEEGLPPFPLSNAEFAAHVTSRVANGARAAVCSLAGDPTAGGNWNAVKAEDIDAQCPAGRNNYLNCSSFLLDEDGAIHARKDRFSAFHFIMFDDVGTKVERSKLDGFKPTWEIETSPGNSQIGVCFRTPLEDQAIVTALQKAVIEAGLCDAGAKGVARWARLPNAINGKSKYTDSTGNPYRCRLTAWNPDVAYTVEKLTEALGISVTPVASLPVLKVGHGTRPAFTPERGDDVYTPRSAQNPVLQALRDRGLYKQALAPGRHDITCPWVSEHTDAIDSGSAYFEPSKEYPAGGFCCQHSHGDQYHIGKLVEHLGLQSGQGRWTATIRLVAGEILRIRSAAERVLALQGGYYQSGGMIVSIKTDPVTGDISTIAVTEQELTAALAGAADWEKYDGRSSKSVRCDPPVRIVQLLHRAQTYDHLPHLHGLVRQPYIRDKDGQVVTTPGYDSVSGIYASFDPAAFPLPEPTEEAARTALAKLKELLSEFHFRGETDRSASISAMLTGAVRSRLPTAPAFNITASTPGSGKSYLAAAITPFTGPGTPLKVSYPTSADEATKAMLSLLLQAPAAISFDDMQSDWKPFGTMNRMLTSDTITDRILGVSRSATVSTRCLILGTGNNVDAVQDMRRRVVTIRLAPRVEVPATLRYQGNPVEQISTRRGEYVSAALTIIRAWEKAGRPKADVANIGSFELWSDYCRFPLIWLGEPDPAASIMEQLHDNPDQDALGGFIAAWWACFGNKVVTVRAIIEAAHRNDNLREAMEELPIADRQSINRGKFGWYLKKQSHRIVGGMEIRKGDSSERNAWCVAKVALPASDPVLPPLAE
ncbi:hypothetical protein BH10PLA2_BH10PLA2_01010 [soil metagenome]